MKSSYDYESVIHNFCITASNDANCKLSETCDILFGLLKKPVDVSKFALHFRVTRIDAQKLFFLHFLY